MIIDSRVMKFPDKFIFLAIDYKKGGKINTITLMTCLKQLTTTVMISWREKCNLRDTYYKGVSDLEMCMDYFALPGTSCKNLNFPPILLKKNLATSQKTFRLTTLDWLLISDD